MKTCQLRAKVGNTHEHRLTCPIAVLKLSISMAALADSPKVQRGLRGSSTRMWASKELIFFSLNA
jgi:hypothetical protein